MVEPSVSTRPLSVAQVEVAAVEVASLVVAAITPVVEVEGMVEVDIVCTLADRISNSLLTPSHRWRWRV